MTDKLEPNPWQLPVLSLEAPLNQPINSNVNITYLTSTDDVATVYTTGSSGEIGSVEDALCQKCHQRKATENWTGEGGTLAYIHGCYQRWCQICVLETQLEFAKNQMMRIPVLEKQLEEERLKESK